MDVVHVLISAQEWCPLRVDYPGDLRVWIRVTNGGDGRERVNDVAE
ncbi:MAG: hypothetical protein QOI04_2043 [Verrucomicrobiota bacterium]